MFLFSGGTAVKRARALRGAIWVGLSYLEIIMTLQKTSSRYGVDDLMGTSFPPKAVTSWRPGWCNG